MQNNKSLLFPLLLVFYETIIYLSNDMYLPALPQIAKDFSVSHSQIQLSLTTWFLGATSMQLIFGPLSDRFGRRPILLFGGIFFIVATAICAAIPNIHALLIARFFQGSAICSMVTAGYASIHEVYDQKQAIRLLALMSSITVLAPAFGPLVGSLVIYFFSWQWIFWILTLGAILAIALLFQWMPESNTIDMRRSLEIKALLKSYYAILTNLRFIAIMSVFCLVFCCFIFWLSSGPFIVVNEFKLSTFVFGICQTLIFMGFIIANYLVKHLIENIGIQKLIQNGLRIALFGGALTLISTILLPHFMYGIIIAMVIFSFGSGFAFAPLNRLIIETSQEPMGARMAIFSTLMSAASVLGSILASVFYNGTLISFGSVLFILIAGACLLRFITMRSP